jgi:hypothetical protein
MKWILIFNFIFIQAVAQFPVSDSVLLQQLVVRARQQVESLREIVKYGKKDSDSMDRVRASLGQLTAGLNQTVEKFKGSKAYNQALLELQKKQEYQNTFKDSENVRTQIPAESQKPPENIADGIQFQKQSVQGNEADFQQQNKIQAALSTAQPGFIPKLQTQVQLGQWQTDIRLSTQITELLAVIHAMREELHLLRAKQDDQNGLSRLLSGAEMQNEKLKKRGLNESIEPR